jgi:hypothetical protein
MCGGVSVDASSAGAGMAGLSSTRISSTLVPARTKRVRSVGLSALWPRGPRRISMARPLRSTAVKAAYVVGVVNHFFLSSSPSSLAGGGAVLMQRRRMRSEFSVTATVGTRDAASLMGGGMRFAMSASLRVNSRRV